MAYLPWTFKIFWGPIIDSFTYRVMGRRRPWILFAQSGMALTLIAMLWMGDLSANIGLLGWMFFFHNCFASLQDVSCDALAVDILLPEEQGKVNGAMWGSKVIKSPENFSNFQAMCFGTAGITAAECVKKIVDKKISNDLPIVVSGSTGGVGSVAVGLLSKLGYEVHAITGKPNESDVLESIGATQIISRDEYMSEPTKALDKGIYASGVDTVGGDILAKMISMISNQGVVSCCGNVGGAMFSSSVFPFILRGVQLSGIDSAESPIEVKRELWGLLSDSWSVDLEKQTKTVGISDIGPEIDKILKGGQVGRVVIKHGD